jgi:hypothetical protein
LNRDHLGDRQIRPAHLAGRCNCGGRRGVSSRAAEKSNALIINDPQPVADIADIWGSSAQMATVGIFALLLVTCLYFCRPLLLPVLAAALIATTFSPLINHASRHGVSSWVTAVVLVAYVLRRSMSMIRVFS